MEQKHERPDHRRIVLLVACVLAIVGISAMALSEEAEASGAADNWYYDQLPDFPQKLYDASKKITDSRMSYSFYYDTSIMDSNSWNAILNTYAGMAYEALKCEWLGMHILDGPIHVGIVNTTVTVSYDHTDLYSSNATATRWINSALASYEIDTTSRYTTVKSIHDVVCNTLTYSERVLTERDYSLYNAVKGDHIVVCEGYAKMFKALCDLYNVPCVIVLGQAKESYTAEPVNHMYNYVQMNDGKWYMVDATWDDLDEGTVYTYFLAGSNTDGFFTKVYESHKPGIFGLNPPPLSSKKYEPASLTISYNSATKTMSFDGKFDIPSGDSAHATWTSYSSLVENIVISDDVTAIGDKAFYKFSKLKSVTIGNGVKRIGDRAFANCTSLTSVSIPSSVTSIDDYAFYSCTSLNSLTTSSGLTSIGIKAFYGCTGLRSVTIANTVATIGSNAFNGCKFFDVDGTTALSAVPADIAGYKFTGTASKLVLDTKFVVGYEFLKSGLKYQVTSALSKDRQVALVGFSGAPSSLVVPSYVSTTVGNVPVTSIGGKAFYECGTLASADLGSVKTIGNKAFAYCTSLKSITVPSTVVTIGEYAFYKCSSATSLVTSAGLEKIGYRAFYDCTGLKSVTIGKNVSSIGGSAFYGCSFYDADGTTALSAIPEYLAGYKFTGTASKLVLDTKFVVGYEFWKSGLKYQVTSSLAKDRQLAVVGYSGSITSLVVPENVNTSAGLFPVTSIGTKAFYGCTTLKSADIGSVTTIGTKAFAGCSSLETLSTLKNVSSVSPYAFFGCDSLTKVVISGTGSSIGASAFSGCDGLKVVKILGSGISLGDYAFNGCASLSTLNLSGVKTIGFKTFMNCTSITKLALPNVTTITKYAFYGCDSISSVEFGASLKGIGSYAFDGHSFYSSNGKTKLTVTASNLGGHSFSGTPAKLVMTA